MEKFKNNRILNELMKNKIFSEKEAKKIFRKFSKLTHPDLTKKETSKDFIDLKNELDEALAVINNPFILSNLVKEENILCAETPPTNIRENLYRYLDIYLSRGLYLQKIRIKDLKKNETLISKIIEIGKIYDKDFASLFENFNNFYFQPFEEWYEERQLKNAKKLFINGVRKFLDYQKNGNILNLRMAKSYFNDAHYEYLNKSKADYNSNIIRLIEWFQIELQKPPVNKEF